MGKLKALDKNLNLTNKRIILRVDLNVPMQEGKVTDITRIKKIIPIIKDFINKKAKIVLISHLGRVFWIIPFNVVSRIIFSSFRESR